jgi:hypothetical protein
MATTSRDVAHDPVLNLCRAMRQRRTRSPIRSTSADGERSNISRNRDDRCRREGADVAAGVAAMGAVIPVGTHVGIAG